MCSNTQTSPVAVLAYKHALKMTQSESESAMAERKLAEVDAALAVQRERKSKINTTDAGVQYGGNF